MIIRHLTLSSNDFTLPNLLSCCHLGSSNSSVSECSFLFDSCLGKVEPIIQFDLEHRCLAHGHKLHYPDNYFYSTGSS
jgi:hypothetical protein